MSKEQQQPYAPNHMVLLPEEHHALLQAIRPRVNTVEAANIEQKTRTLVSFSTDEYPAYCYTPYNGDPVAYVDTAVTHYREAGQQYPVITAWHQDIIHMDSQQGVQLRKLIRQTNGEIYSHYAPYARQVNSPLATSGRLQEYFPNTLEAVATGSRKAADAAHFVTLQGVAREFLSETLSATERHNVGVERGAAIDASYREAMQQKIATDHRFPLVDFWHLADRERIDIAKSAAQACLMVIRYAHEYGSSDQLRALVAPRVVRPTSELVSAMSKLSDIGRRAALQAFFDESVSKDNPSFPHALESIMASYGSADSKVERRAETLETVWTANIGDQVQIGEEGMPLTRKDFEAEIANIMEGTAERMYQQRKSNKPFHKTHWNTASSDVVEKLLGSSHARIQNVRIQLLDPEVMDIKDVAPENVRCYEIAMDAKSTGKPAIPMSIRTAVYSRETDNYIELRRTAKGKAVGANALQLQQELSRMYPRGRLFVLSRGSRALAKDPQL